MTRSHLAATLALLATSLILLTGFGKEQPFWPQWGRNAQHTGMVDIPAQPLDNKLEDIVYDDFVQQEKAENKVFYGFSVLSAHYQATLVAACPPGARRDVYRIQAEPGHARASEPHMPGVVEHVVIGAGRALVGVAGQPTELGPGDYLRYPGDVPHVFEALAPRTQAVLVSEHT